MFSREDLKQRISDMYGTQVAFAKKIGMTRTSINRILRDGIETTSMASACKICAALNIPFEELIEAPGPSATPEEKRKIDEAKKMYELYLSKPEMQPAVDVLLGYRPPIKSEDDSNGKTE